MEEVSSKAEDCPKPIRMEGLTKFYGAHKGIEELTLAAEPGEVLGFLGPNGSGKTTTIRVLLGFLRPTAGRAAVLGLDIARQSLEVRRRVGYLPGDVSLYGERTGAELLDFALRVRGLRSRRWPRLWRRRWMRQCTGPSRSCPEECAKRWRSS